MDADAFDRIARSLSVPGTRRRLVRLLATLPLAALLPALSGAARTRRRERGNRTHAEACIPTGKKCPAKKPRGKPGRQLRCNDCCQGFVSVDATGQRRCGCIPTGVGCGTKGSAGCCSGSCQGGVCRPATAACQPRTSCPPGACGSVGDGCGGTIACGPCPCAPPCHPTCQTCNAGTGECEDVAPGTACDDGNACTTNDTCQGGDCVGGDPVACTPQDTCHVAGICDTNTGVCSNPERANGSTCTTCAACQSGGCLPCDSDDCIAGECTETCGASIDPGPPARATFTVQDNDGVVRIVVTRSENADTIVPPFTEGTTEPVTVTSTKIDQTQPATVVFEVTDGTGAIRRCGLLF